MERSINKVEKTMIESKQAREGERERVAERIQSFLIEDSCHFGWLKNKHTFGQV